MNLYLLVFILLALGSIVEWFRPQYRKSVYRVCWTVMTALLCFRFGQGTDYVTYQAIYDSIPMAVDLSRGYVFGVYPELGWRLLCALFKAFGAPFWVFTMALGLAEMLLLHRVLTKYAPLRTAGLFLAYPVLFLTYMVSGLRQGLAMCIFLGLALPFYLEKKWVRYVAVVFLAASFHKVGYIWLILPVVYVCSVRIMAVLAGVSALGGLMFQIPVVQGLITSVLPYYHVRQFLMEGDVSLFALGERLLTALVLLLVYEKVSRDGGGMDREDELLLKAYLCGACLYLLLCGNSYYASRYAAAFKVIECVLAVRLVKKEHWLARAAAVFFLGLTLLMGVKNMNAMIREGGYDTAQVSVWNFPYVSVFHQSGIEQYLPYEENLLRITEIQLNDQELWRLDEETE